MSRNYLEQVVTLFVIMTVSVNAVPVAWMQVKKRLLVGRGYFKAEDAIR